MYILATYDLDNPSSGAHKKVNEIFEKYGFYDNVCIGGEYLELPTTTKLKYADNINTLTLKIEKKKLLKAFEEEDINIGVLILSSCSEIV
ncbi:hypothetical protein [Kosmotoga pacifica]|uniref:Uncharacterized protein n=1 Tax=Kosmotoga pacifica TaxID=1330330 RepID=A0A0G2ZAG0_9BACT|nr:hypothetical protein [Kosmotoga pacifica]AKI96564.1 hypothetical protein IX53_00590 [Kosmotoga pacifica]